MLYLPVLSSSLPFVESRIPLRRPAPLAKIKTHEANVQKKSIQIENETVEIKLEKLKTLYDRGLIKEEVYVSKQQELLNKL